MKQDTSNTAQAMWIGIGSICSFMFSIVSAAILSRYLSKGDYGTYKQVMYVYNTLLTVFTLGLPLSYSYFLPRVNLPEGKSLVNKLNLCFVILGTFFSFFLYFGADLFASILNNSDLSNNIKIFSSVPMLILPTMGLQGILATYKQTLWNAIYVVATRILMLLFVALPVIFIKPSVEIALWGFNIASLISLVLALKIKNIPFRKVTKTACQIKYKEIFNYSIPLMVAGLLGVAISAADQFYVSRFFGREVFADFSNGSMELPFVGMVLSAGGTVLLPIFSKMISQNVEKKLIIELWERTAVKAAYILYPIIVFCIFFASDIMTLIYGEMYYSSAIYFRIMLMANFFTVVQFYPIILALGKTKDYALVHIVVLVLVWLLELFVVRYLQSSIFVTVVSVICKVLKFLLMMKIVANAISIKMLSLFPLKKLLLITISCLIAGLISYYIVCLIPIKSKEIINLTVGFVCFYLMVFLTGILFGIDYLSVIRPVTEKLYKK